MSTEDRPLAYGPVPRGPCNPSPPPENIAAQFDTPQRLDAAADRMIDYYESAYQFLNRTLLPICYCCGRPATESSASGPLCLRRMESGEEVFRA